MRSASQEACHSHQVFAERKTSHAQNMTPAAPASHFATLEGFAIGCVGCVNKTNLSKVVHRMLLLPYAMHCYATSCAMSKSGLVWTGNSLQE